MNRIKFLCSALLLGLLCLPAPAQNSNVVRGKVIAATDGEPLISVSVTEVDASNRIVGVTITNYDGEFVMTVNNRANKLRFKYLGFETKDVEIGNKSVFNIGLEEQTHTLTDVVVSAKAIQSDGRFVIPEREVSMAMQKISAEEFDGIQVASIDDALQGRIAGLDIVNVSGEPGAGMSMRVRGTTSINASSEPLIVINDIPYDTEIDDSFDFATANQDQYAQLINVNPDDIESITVLKDAASTAIWGSKGANGVLMITTKKGKVGPTRVNYSYSMTRARQPEGMNMLDGDGYTMLMKQAYYNPNLENASSDIPEFNYDQNFTEYENYNNNTDWLAEVRRIGFTHDNNLTISGGGEKVTFRVSAAYYTQTGTVIGQLLNRLSLRSNINYQVSDRITFTSDFAYSYSDNDKNYDNPLGNAYKKMPNLSVYAQDLDGNDTDVYYHIRLDSQLNDSQKTLSNPVAEALLAQNTQRSYRTSPVFTLSYELLDRSKTEGSLKAQLTASFDINSSQKSAYYPKEASNQVWTSDKVNLSEGGESESLSFSGRAQLTWRPALPNPDHSIQLMGRFNVGTGNNSSLSSSIYGLPSSLIRSHSVEAYMNSMSNSFGESRSLGWSGSGHYAFKGRYIMDFTLSSNGSSKFGQNKRFGFFPGASFKWIMSDENFFGPLREYVSQLSPRYSFGISGNEPSDEYLMYSRYDKYDQGYMDMIAYKPKNLQLSNLSWEKTYQHNFGLDVEFLNGRFGVDYNYYYKHTTDLLFKDLGLASSSGFASLSYQNVGVMDNNGWEFNAHMRDLFTYEKFHVDFNFNFSNNRNTIVELTDEVLAKYNPDYTYENGKYLTRIQVGNSVGSIYGFKYKGVYQYSTYDPENPDATCPIVRDADGNAILDADGNTKPMMFAYGTSSQYEFKAGDAIYEDVNHDGSIDELDIVYLGNSLPKVNGGFGITLRWKQLSVNGFFNYRIGNKVVNGARMNAENMYSNDNQSVATNWRWRKEGDQTEMPRALYNYGYNWLGSDRYVEDASFLRFKYFTINYSVPKEVLKPYKINQMSLYLSFQNLGVLTKYTGVDPEVGTGGFSVATDNSKTPRSKDILLRLRLGF